MAKIIKNPKTIQIVEEDSVLKVSLHYGIGAEEYPDLVMRKGMVVSLTPQEQATAQQVMDWATNKMEEHEGI